MRRIAAYRDATGDKAVTLTHGRLRGVYYHAAVPPSQRQAVIHDWYKKWGFPRYERTKDQQPPYQNGLEGKREFTRQVDSRPPVPLSEVSLTQAGSGTIVSRCAPFAHPAGMEQHKQPQ